MVPSHLLTNSRAYHGKRMRLLMHVCSVCDRRFKNKLALRMHERLAHTRPDHVDDSLETQLHGCGSSQQVALHTSDVIFSVGDIQCNENAALNVRECVMDVRPDTVEDLLESQSALLDVNVEVISGHKSSCIASGMMRHSDQEQSNNIDVAKLIGLKKNLKYVNVSGSTGDC